MRRIQEFAREAGISKRMLRYLEEQGLLIPDREENDYRVYGDHHLARLKRIRAWQALGFSFREIKRLEEISPEELEHRLELLRDRHQEELARQLEQLEGLRRTLRQVREQPLAALPVPTEPWGAGFRARLLERVELRDRVIYGPYPELDRMNASLENLLRDLRFKVQRTEFMKYGDQALGLSSGEIRIWESRRDYAYFFLFLPEELLLSLGDPEAFEERLREAFQEAVTAGLQPLCLEPSGRMFGGAGLDRLGGTLEICVRIGFSVNAGAGRALEAALIFPFTFLQNSRRGGGEASARAGRALHSSVIHLTPEDLLHRTKSVSQEDYLLTTLLADAETRHRLSEVLSPAARQLVAEDLERLVRKVQSAWKD